MSDIKISYEILSNIYKNKAYSSIELGKNLEYANSSKWVTKLVYGVLERDVELEYYLSHMTKKRPQASVVIILKMGMYCIKYMDSMPIYAVVNNMVDLTEFIGKRQVKGFVNSFLKTFSTQKTELPTLRAPRLSVESSTPLWLVIKYIKQYGYDATEQFLMTPSKKKEHIRANTRVTNLDEVIHQLDEMKIEYEKSPVGGLWVDNSKEIHKLFEQGLITIQSMTSMLCVQAMQIKDGDKVLDMCSAPGGKGIYAQEVASNVEVVACDIHPHRVELIKSYAHRMKADQIAILEHDAMTFDPKFEGVFDKVLCDVPCSGFGIAKKKPDIYLNTTLSDVESLANIQYEILSNAVRYVASGGSLVYSTCTLLREENYNIVGKFVKEHPEWEIEYHHQYLPNEEGFDGFFVARLRRKKDEDIA